MGRGLSRHPDRVNVTWIDPSSLYLWFPITALYLLMNIAHRQWAQAGPSVIQQYITRCRRLLLSLEVYMHSQRYM
ncbi:hypothetical protein P3T76_002929 [Phytophthora citrophthora]|uniref:Uncharacterized protein n=1 Tax=Phytophthora citrophthora TaxID=4793 RepID=A0AAD9GWH2_9STRA|nr:hypothetical protein P3T76_002906 [Phytophthora citrophthora]KAK1945859.1 hypothetical protein P3T76_002907 [Phytophthora citrophthora]KAK1945860.1 hypothetical protein P3T76_002908 [Phytophthora citrophthora]KAK1945861.1 hypothetical protein P3T76_002909 [Phytophthora citrophthora]KAK1945862.1 hypothetical protein P3T76_002910 [Phytophthora citrophthora]